VSPVKIIIVVITHGTPAIADSVIVKIVETIPATIAVAGPIIIKFTTITPATITTVDDIHENVVTRSITSMI
jgi:hypothetical protein